MTVGSKRMCVERVLCDQEVRGKNLATSSISSPHKRPRREIRRPDDTKCMRYTVTSVLYEEVRAAYAGCWPIDERVQNFSKRPRLESHW